MITCVVMDYSASTAYKHCTLLDDAYRGALVYSGVGADAMGVEYDEK